MSESDDENYVTFGVPLDPLDEESLPRKKPVTIEDQYAYDAQGRRRFHGAFTGGFSAGYFNTVGTRDGWRPQQFKSSRSSKAENIAQRPEDFMDEEDTSEFGIAPQGIRATSDYMDHGQKGKKRERIVQDNTGPIPGTPVLKDLLKPVKETVGVVMLKKMGWKPGQGVGPRVTKQEKKKIKKQNEKMKIYGCALPHQVTADNRSDSEDSDNNDTGITFAPDDYEPYRANPKDNYFGIGYSGLDRRPVLSSHVNLFDIPAFKVQDKNKKLSIRGQAFGVGAFEADDDDIYEKEDMSRYDFALGPERKTKSRWSQEDRSEGNNCLEGFVPAKEQLESKKIFRPPELPKDFVPVHAVRKSRFYPPIERLPIIQENGKRPELNAKDRARLLDDPRENNKPSENVISKASSVASNIVSRSLNLHGKQQIEERQKLQDQQAKTTPSWMDKLNTQSFIKGDVIDSANSSAGSLKKLEDFKDSLPRSDDSQLGENVEEKNSQPLKPFIADLDKQRRFEQYLTFLRNNEKHKLDSIQPLSMTEWDRDHEREEFEQAARLFDKPAIDTTKEQTKDKDAPNSSDISVGSMEDQMKQAAKMKMFGKLTREKKEWKPANIVCKRFNVPEPKIGCAQPGIEKKTKFSVFESLDWSTSSKFSKASDVVQKQEEPRTVSQATQIEKSQCSFPVKDESTTSIDKKSSEVVLEKVKNFEASYEKVFGKGMQEQKDEEDVEKLRQDERKSKNSIEEKKDLFKAIFLSSSSSEDSESEAEEKVDSEIVKSVLIGKDPSELNTQRNTSPPRGIFAKLDLDNLLKPLKRPEEKEDKDGSSSSKTPTDSSGKMEIEAVVAKNQGNGMLEDPPAQDVYGPALPSTFIKSDSSTSQATDSSTPKPVFKSVVVPKTNTVDVGKWVERGKLKKSKKEKKKHKHKERSKHKHKSKKDKR